MVFSVCWPSPVLWWPCICSALCKEISWYSSSQLIFGLFSSCCLFGEFSLRVIKLKGSQHLLLEPFSSIPRSLFCLQVTPTGCRNNDQILRQKRRRLWAISPWKSLRKWDAWLFLVPSKLRVKRQLARVSVPYAIPLKLVIILVVVLICLELKREVTIELKKKDIKPVQLPLATQSQLLGL